MKEALSPSAASVQVAIAAPTRLYPVSHVYVAVSPRSSPSTATSPLSGLTGTAHFNISVVYKKLLDYTSTLTEDCECMHDGPVYNIDWSIPVEEQFR